ncbi:unnamed protein product [Closterium sp. NIES-53]
MSKAHAPFPPVALAHSPLSPILTPLHRPCSLLPVAHASPSRRTIPSFPPSALPHMSLFQPSSFLIPSLPPCPPDSSPPSALPPYLSSSFPPVLPTFLPFFLLISPVLPSRQGGNPGGDGAAGHQHSHGGHHHPPSSTPAPPCSPLLTCPRGDTTTSRAPRGERAYLISGLSLRYPLSLPRLPRHKSHGKGRGMGVSHRTAPHHSASHLIVLHHMTWHHPPSTPPRLSEHAAESNGDGGGISAANHGSPAGGHREALRVHGAHAAVSDVACSSHHWPQKSTSPRRFVSSTSRR